MAEERGDRPESVGGGESRPGETNLEAARQAQSADDHGPADDGTDTPPAEPAADDHGPADDGTDTPPAEPAADDHGPADDGTDTPPAEPSTDDETSQAELSGLGGARQDVPSKHPGEYVPATEAPPTVDGPHDSPERWAHEINPDPEAPGRDNNCGECSRAVESTWEGEPAVAAAMADADAPGEPARRMQDWVAKPPEAASMDGIAERVTELGPGSSAIVGCYWEGGGGHYFNAVNDDGHIKAVDGQSGRVEPWPPSGDGLGFSEDDMTSSWAYYLSGEG